MAKKQSRRTVSLRRDTYERALDFANAQHLSLAELVTLGLKAIGVDVGEQQHRPIEHTRLAEHARNRATRIMARRNGIQTPTIPGVFTNPPAVESRGGGEVCANRYAPVAYRPSLERQLLGDGVANAMGFR